MSRMEINSLTNLIESSEVGGYTLPAELLDSYRTYQRVKALEVPQPAAVDMDAAAARVVSAVAAGEGVDLVAAASVFEDKEREKRNATQAAGILRLAVEQASGTVTLLTSDLTETIIANHLRPAYAELHEEVRKTTQALDGIGLDPHQILKAPAKVRNAYLELPALADKSDVIRKAWRLANTIGHRQPQHDTNGLYSTFRKPMTFFPTWRHPARIPAIPFPADRVERLVWMLSPEAQAAEPWLPTVAEQDAAWVAQFEATMPKRAPWNRVVANA